LGKYTVTKKYTVRRLKMALSDVKARNAKPRQKSYKLTDAGGLYLLVASAGGKYWRFDYRYDGKRKTLALGTYPEISLLDARSRLCEARKAIAHGIDPGEQKKALKKVQADIKNSFEVVAREWHGKNKTAWTPGHADTLNERLERDVFPWLGQQPIDNIKAPDVLRVLRRVESRGAIETAHRIKTVCGQVFRYAVATGRADSDPTAALKGALPLRKVKHRAAITEPNKFGDLLRAIDGYEGSFVVKCALQIQALTFVRPGELRHAEWSEIDLDAAQWNIPAEKMKLRLPHIVPLSSQAVDILKELKPLTGVGRYVFPNGRGLARPLSDNGVLVALRTMGFTKDQMTGHGFRAAARTILDEVLNQRVDLIEQQLAHAVKDPNGRAYNRTAHLPARREMMQLWADYLDSLKAGTKILPITKAK
jgi:integrase